MRNLKQLLQMNYTEEALKNCIEIWTKSIEGTAIGNIINEVK